jgi:protein phosphatase-4 regulatory subunit 3
MNDGMIMERFQLPSPPSIQNLDDVADAIASLQQQHHLQQRELLSTCITASECLYYKQLLDIFLTAESHGNFAKLATLAACIKTILLLNDPTILELTITDEAIFDRACACLEYDPDLREKANHRWFLRERVKFRTVVPMNDTDLEQAIHRTFRVQYLRDTLLRPTMDESCLSTLSSLQTFTHADVIKGVTMSTYGTATDSTTEGSRELRDSYLVRVMRRLGIDLYTLRHFDWMELASFKNQDHGKMDNTNKEDTKQLLQDNVRDDKACDHTNVSNLPTIWKQYLAPQDDSAESRRMRRRDALSFLRELFQMVRLSLQQCDRDDFFAVICTLEIEMFASNPSMVDNHKFNEANVVPTNDSQHGNNDNNSILVSPERNREICAQSSNILSLLSNVLLDPNADVSEKGAALEILAGVAMHDASLIRRHTLDCSRAWKSANLSISHPDANKQKQVLLVGPPDDVLSALIFLLSVETDAGVLLQVSEIMRIILDTDAMDQTLIYPTFADEADGIVPGIVHNPPHDQHNQPLGNDGVAGPTNSDQAQFLSVFYDYYADWLVAPFQYTVAHPICRVPDNVFRHPLDSSLMKSLMSKHQDSFRENDPVLKLIAFCPVRLSFTVELLSFCVRAHLCRMKTFLLKSRVMGNVLQLLKFHPIGVPGDRCLKLAILRFLRAILSVNDESYHRHIIQHNLFEYVFDTFRENPVGDNLVSSAVVEMCDFINTENIKCLLEYIGRRHLIPKNSQTMSLEEVSSPYVNTITALRKAYEANVEETQRLLETGQSSPGGSRYFPGGIHFTSSTKSASRMLSGKALEDQRKFREKDDEESYFDMDDDDEDEGMSTNPIGIASDVTSMPQDKESDLHRTPRMFSLSETPLGAYHQFEEIEER